MQNTKLFVALAMLVMAFAGSQAAEPVLVQTNVPRYVLVTGLAGDAPVYYKFDTATGQCYYQQIHGNELKSNYYHVPGIPLPEDEIYPGRFQSQVEQAQKDGSREWRIVVLDTKSGRVWESKYYHKLGFREVPVVEDGEK